MRIVLVLGALRKITQTDELFILSTYKAARVDGTSGLSYFVLKVYKSKICLWHKNKNIRLGSKFNKAQKYAFVCCP